jgi:hypothetical protein
MEGESFVVSVFRRIGPRFAGSIAALCLTLCNSGTGQDPAKVPVYPEIGPTTHFLDHGALIAGFAESGWYKANIPFIDIPDKQIQEIYYYR